MNATLLLSESQSSSPYVGPISFEEKDQKIFFGREYEISEISSLIVAHTIFLLYAQSGAGKTSLLNAGLIPKMRQKGFEVLPVARVRGLPLDDSQLKKVKNIYVFYTLLNWAETPNPEELFNQSLVDFLKNKKLTVNTEEAPVRYVIIFDQFEELFSLYPERWKDREDFFKQISKILEDSDLPPLRIVFLMREDYVARMDSYAYLLPGQLRIRFRLELLREDKALDAIKKPLEFVKSPISGKLAKEIVKELLWEKRINEAGVPTTYIGEFVEPFLLQIVCLYLWENYWKDHKFLPNVNQLSEEDREFIKGSIKDALKFYYKSVVEHASQKSRYTQKDISIWIENKFIPNGQRIPVGNIHQMDSKVEALNQKNLIRREKVGNLTWYELTHAWYELTHDVWINVIQDFNKEWSREKEDYRKTFLERSKNWKNNGKYLDDVVHFFLLDNEFVKSYNWARENRTNINDELGEDFLSACKEALSKISKKLASNKSRELAEQSKTLQKKILDAVFSLQWRL